MSEETVLRALALCVALASVETLHGIARTVWLVPRVGKERALKLSIVSGSLLALGVCWLLVPAMGLHRLGQQLALGLGLALFMAGFDLSLGVLLLRRPWRRVLQQDFNPASGNYLLLGLILLLFFPALVMGLRAGP
jgi:hypothetical protein